MDGGWGAPDRAVQSSGKSTGQVCVLGSFLRVALLCTSHPLGIFWFPSLEIRARDLSWALLEA